ncbi:VWA domain-containing protein [Roseovarius sp. S4756]|uniref:VWA domain-containing protein n=1 Tax=Roseovarius maritimus TaxID=3342637 RepID=UPI003B674B53
MKHTIFNAATLSLVGTLAFSTTAYAADENVMIVFDGSNSMWGQIDGTAKIEIARDVMENLLGEWTADRNVGLMAYGHRRRGDCTDIETLVAPGKDTRAGILERIGGITPTGKTPLTTAVERAATEMSYADRPATVILISDGLESCERDPCALADALEKGGVGFTAHVVGFGLGDADASALSCLADRTGGQYLSAGNADELGKAFASVSEAVSTPEPAAEPQPEPEPEYDVTLDAPATALAGDKIRVSWTGTVAAQDYITIVPMGAEEGSAENYIRVSDDSENDLQAPGETGLYELRYVLNEGRRTLASKPIEITEPEVTLSAPATALAGDKIRVSWTGTVAAQDYITIVPMGAEEGSAENYIRVGDDSENDLQAPGQTGLYELRYVLNEGRRTLASKPIEITEPEVTLDAPATALAGDKIRVSWTGTVAAQDYITIVPMGAEEGSAENYIRVSDDSENDLQAPGETGLYELRYVLNEGRRTLASKPIEITEPEVTLSGPATALAGDKIRVSWTGTVAAQDYITIVPMGAEEGSAENYIRVSDDSENDLQAPGETGLYELRYVLNEGRRTLASKPIEITEPEVTLSGPATALAGDKIRVSWTGTVAPQDYITIVPMGAEEGSAENYIRVGGDSENDLQAPGQTGLYELRYVLNEGRRTLASKPIEITEPEVTLSGPNEIRAEDTIGISWTGAVHGQDYVTIVPIGTPDEESATYVRVGENTDAKLAAPAERGLYELRYVLNEGRRVLARHPIEVLAADAALESGASLSAPETAAAGATISVDWTVQNASGDQRISIARANQATFTWITAIKIDGAPPVSITLPDAPGMYELRFLDIPGQSVLARRIIRVE